MKKEQLEFNEINELESFFASFTQKGSEYLWVKLLVYFTESEFIELNIINILTREESLFDHLMNKF